jgi:hypothetical protein
MAPSTRSPFQSPVFPWVLAHPESSEGSAIMNGILFSTKFFAFISAQMAFATLAHAMCIHPYGAGETRLRAEGASSVVSSGDNIGVYEWGGGDAWLLIESFYDQNANHYVPGSDDYWVPASNGGGGPGGPGDPGEQPHPQSANCATVLPPTVVTGTPFPGSLGLYIVRVGIQPGYGPAGGGGAIYRNPSPRVGHVQASTHITCSNSSDLEREPAAQLAIQQSLTSPLPRRGIYTVNFAPGSSQDWLVTQPMFSNFGLQPASGCRGP